VHVTRNVLDALPKRLHPEAKEALEAIHTAPTRTKALEAVQRFAEKFSAFEKAVSKITGQLDVLLRFYDYPAEHWTHLKTSNPISVNRPGRALRKQAA
jgi:transposase-like protein